MRTCPIAAIRFCLLLLAWTAVACAQDPLQQLHDPDDQVRLRAIQTLGSARVAAAVAPLLGLLEHENPLLRATVVEALGRIGDARAVAPLLARLDDDFALVQVAAVTALGHLRDVRAAAPLLARAADPDAPYRLQALGALGEIGEPAGVRLLFSLISDPDVKVRVAAREGLKAVSAAHALPAASAALDSTSEEVRVLALRMLLQLDEAPILPPMLRAARDRSPTVRVEAAQMLGGIVDPQAGKALATLLGDPVKPVRLAAASALGSNVPPEAVPMLLGWLTGPDDAARQAALRSLMLYDDPRIAEALAKLLASPDPMLRLSAASGLAARNDARALSPLLALARDANPAIKQQALTALGRCRDERAAATLLQALADPSLSSRIIPALRRQGEVAVALLAQRAKTAATTAERLRYYDALYQLRDPGSSEVFLTALQRDDPALLEGVLQIIGRTRRRSDEYQVRDFLLGVRPPIAFVLPARSLERSWLASERLTGILLTLLRNGRASTRTVLQAMQQMGPDHRGAVVNALMPYVAGDDESLRTLALQVLAETGYDRSGAAQSLLLILLRERTPNIYQLAYQALLRQRNITDPTALVALLTKETDWRRRAALEEILAHNGDIRAVDPLKSLFISEKYGPAGLRERAAFGLGLIGDARAVPILIETLEDPVEWVRSAAAWALGEIGDTRAIAPLRARVLKDEPRFQGRAYRALAQLGDPGGWEMLLPILDRGDVMAQELAFHALNEIRLPGVVDPLCAHLQLARESYMLRVFPALGAVRDRRAIPALRQYAQQHGNSVWTSTALVQLGDRQAIDRLVNILRGGADPAQCNEALAALAETTDPRARAAVAAYLQDRDPLTRALAARALVRFGDRRGALVLIGCLDNEHGDVLAYDIALLTLSALPGPAAFGGLGDPALTRKMLQKLREGGVPQRIEAVRALGVIGTGDAVEPLMLALKDAHSRVREAAAASLGKLADAAARAALTAALQDESSRVREQAAGGLGRLQDTDAVAPLIELLRREQGTRTVAAAMHSLRLLTGREFKDAARWVQWHGEGMP